MTNCILDHFRQTTLAPSYLLLFLAQKAELQVDVVELPDEFSTGSLDNHCPPLQPHLDCATTQQREIKTNG